MIEAELTESLLREFYFNLRYQDKQEIVSIFGSFGVDEFIKICFETNGKTYFLLSDKYKPLALGGANIVNNPKIAQVWLLSTNDALKYRKEIFKYVKRKIKEFKVEYDVLYNFIYKTNFKSLFWLKRYGFKVLNSNNPDYKLFYFSKGEIDFDLRYITRE